MHGFIEGARAAGRRAKEVRLDEGRVRQLEELLVAERTESGRVRAGESEARRESEHLRTELEERAIEIVDIAAELKLALASAGPESAPAIEIANDLTRRGAQLIQLARTRARR